MNRFALSTAPGHGGGLLDPAETSVPFELGPGYAVVSFDVECQPFRLMVDTAARSLILFAPRVRDRLAGLRKLSERRVIGNAGGAVALTEVVLPDASLGTVRLNAQRAALMEGQAPA